MKKLISLRLSEETLAHLEVLGARWSVSRTETIERLIAEAFERRGEPIGHAYPSNVKATDTLYRDEVRPSLIGPWASGGEKDEAE